MHRGASWGAIALSVGTLVFSALAAPGCKVVDTLDEEKATPTPAATPYSADTYAAALRSASLKLRGRLPSAAETAAVRDGGGPAYDAFIDGFLDPAQNAELVPQMKELYRKLFLMGGVISDEGDPDPYAASNTNYDLPANLATWLFTTDAPVTELVTSDRCIGDDLQPLPEAVAQAACEGAPKNATLGNHRAGVIGMRPFLRKYGQANTLNLRRTSLVHQIFSCEIYPDSQDPTALSRTNDVTHTAGVDNDDSTLGSMSWPLNDNLTPDDPSDDFPDPSLGAFTEDPASPARISKKYQSAKGGVSCASCHAKLNYRRTIFTPYTPAGLWSDTRSMANTRDVETGVENNVESPAEINGLDYCGALGDTEADPATGEFGAGNGNASDDDLDPGAFECQENGRGPAIYHGQTARTLREYGFALVNEDATGGRFQRCMTLRHVNFVLGRSQGVLGMGANGGTTPEPLPPQTLEKFQTVYRANEWSTRELMRVAFKSHEFLTGQQ